MKKIEAYIRHEAFEPIRAELLDKGFPSLALSRRQNAPADTVDLTEAEPAPQPA